MPIYEFANEDGGVEDHFFSYDEAPSIGDTIEIEGRTLTRLASVAGSRIMDRPFASMSLEPYHPDANKFDSEGRPVFETKRDREEFLARNAANPHTDKVVWNA